MSEPLLREEVGKIQSDKTLLEEQCEIDARHGKRTCNLLDSASGTNRNLRKNIRVLWVQYDQEIASLRYERDGLQAQISSYDIRPEASCNSLRVGSERLKAY